MHEKGEKNTQKLRAPSHIIDGMRLICGCAKLLKRAVAILLI